MAPPKFREETSKKQCAKARLQDEPMLAGAACKPFLVQRSIMLPCRQPIASLYSPKKLIANRLQAAQATISGAILERQSLPRCLGGSFATAAAARSKMPMRLGSAGRARRSCRGYNTHLAGADLRRGPNFFGARALKRRGDASHDQGGVLAIPVPGCGFGAASTTRGGEFELDEFLSDRPKCRL